MNEGFAIVPFVFAAPELDGFSRDLEALALQRSRAGARHLLSVPAVASLARDPRLTSLACEVLGGDAVPFGATLFDKSDQANWLVAWHQDTALPLLERHAVAGWGPWSTKRGVLYAHAPATALSHVVALRLHLDDSKAENGPLRVLPGISRAWGLERRADSRGGAAHCAGHVYRRALGVLMMRPLVVHASSKVAAASPRRVLHFEYAASAVFADGVRLRAA